MPNEILKEQMSFWGTSMVNKAVTPAKTEEKPKEEIVPDYRVPKNSRISVNTDNVHGLATNVSEILVKKLMREKFDYLTAYRVAQDDNVGIGKLVGAGHRTDVLKKGDIIGVPSGFAKKYPLKTRLSASKR